MTYLKHKKDYTDFAKRPSSDTNLDRLAIIIGVTLLIVIITSGLNVETIGEWIYQVVK